MQREKIFLRVFVAVITLAALVNQASVPAFYACDSALNESHTLAPSPIFKTPLPSKDSDGISPSALSGIEFINIAVSLYNDLVRDGLAPDIAARKLAEQAVSSDAFLKQFSRFKFQQRHIEKRIDGDILHIPYGEDLEVRVYLKSSYPSGLIIKPEERLIERGSGDYCGIELVKRPPEIPKAAKGVAPETVWTDELASALVQPAMRLYKQNSYYERDKINKEKDYDEFFKDYIMTKLKKIREEDRKSGKKSVLTFGVSGSAAVGKTSVIGGFREELTQEFGPEKTIFFDNWLLESSDRPIDKVTGQASEDIFKKFEVDKFIKSIKEFIKGQDLLQPIYNQTAKSSLKMTVDKEGRLIMLFGSKRKVAVKDAPGGGATLLVTDGKGSAVMDEDGNVIKDAPEIFLFDTPFKIEDAGNKNAAGEFILRIFDTRIKVSAVDALKQRRVHIINKKSDEVKDMTYSKTGEVLADSGAILATKGRPWKAKEYVPYEDGVFMVEGILSLYDDATLPPAERLPRLYTTSIFLDADFEIRLERGLAREMARAILRGTAMPPDEIRKYIDKFIDRRDKAEDPVIYPTKNDAEFIATTKTRAEGIFSLYRSGQILFKEFKSVMEGMGLDAENISDEMDRIESDFVFDLLRKNTVNRKLQFTRKVEGANYNSYFLKDKVVVKAPKSPLDERSINILTSRGGDIMVPGMVVDMSNLNIGIEGENIAKQPLRHDKVIIQNEMIVFDDMLKGQTGAEAKKSLDRFFDLQKRMWSLGIVDKKPDFKRYGFTVTNRGRCEVLLFAIDEIGDSSSDLAPDKLRALGDSLEAGLKEYYIEGVKNLLLFMSKETFGADMLNGKTLPKLYHPEISSRQLDYITSLTLEHKAQFLWRVFKNTKIPGFISPELVWAKLWLESAAVYTPEARGAIDGFYKELLASPDMIRSMPPYILKKHILDASGNLRRQDISQIDKFIKYLFRLRLKMVNAGDDKGIRSTIRIKPDVYDAMDSRDREDLLALLSNPGKLDDMVRTSGGRIGIQYRINVYETNEGRTVYMKLRRPISLDGKSVEALRIKGSRPRLKDGSNNVIPYPGNGAGYTPRKMESYGSGAIIVYEPRPEPCGTMFYDNALIEYNTMERFAGSPTRMDIAVGVGRYKDIIFNNSPCGYVICGMEEDDYRLFFEQYDGPLAGSLAAKDVVGAKPRYADIESRLKEFYKDLGTSLRYYNDAGFTHRYMYLGNIGVSFDRDGKIKPVLRDLESTQDITANSPAEKVTDRFLDVARVLYDLISKREYEYKYDELIEIEYASFPELAESFLKGYFYDTDYTDQRFSALLNSLNGGFSSRIRQLAGLKDNKEIDYEELNENNPYFGALISYLKETENNISKKDSSDQRRHISDPRIQAALSKEINKADMSLLPAVKITDKVICHIIDPSLIPQEQASFMTLINKMTRPDNFKEKIIIGNKGEDLDAIIAATLEKYPGAIIDAAVSGREKQAELAKKNILSLVFETEDGPCNFIQLEGVIAALKALQRQDVDSLLVLYSLITGNAFSEAIPGDIKELAKILIFKLPSIEIKDLNELRLLNNAIVKLIQSA